jgi:hypothetical protein
MKEWKQKYAARGAEDSSCPVFMLQQAMRTYVRKDEVVCVSGKLKSLRSQLEFFKGELDRALVLVDEGLGSIGLKVAK